MNNNINIDSKEQQKIYEYTRQNHLEFEWNGLIYIDSGNIYSNSAINIIDDIKDYSSTSMVDINAWNKNGVITRDINISGYTNYIIDKQIGNRIAQDNGSNINNINVDMDKIISISMCI